MTDGGRRGDSKYRSAARHRGLGTCESARGPDADRHVKLLIQFAVEGSLSGAYSHQEKVLARAVSRRVGLRIYVGEKIASLTTNLRVGRSNRSGRAKQNITQDHRLRGQNLNGFSNGFFFRRAARRVPPTGAWDDVG
jgi:hypothetical protein